MPFYQTQVRALQCAHWFPMRLRRALAVCTLVSYEAEKIHWNLSSLRDTFFWATYVHTLFILTSGWRAPFVTTRFSLQSQNQRFLYPTFLFIHSRTYVRMCIYVHMYFRICICLCIECHSLSTCLCLDLPGESTAQSVCVRLRSPSFRTPQDLKGLSWLSRCPHFRGWRCTYVL
jgi:hypothetical protein